MYYKYLLHRLKYYKYPGLSRDQLSLFSAFTDYDNLLLAHKSASHNKHFYAEVKMVNSDKLFYISHIQDLLLSKTFHTSPYEIFDRYEGSKLRHIYKLPYYPDRIVQWGLIQVIGERIISNLTRDTYSSIRGRGPLACLMKLRRDMQYDPENTKYYLKMDVQKFYPSINHDILKEKYCRLFKDKDILDVIFEIIDSVPPNEGVPIGNLLSQYSGNLYLSSFDHWMKEVLHVKHYYRYMDDIVVFGENSEYLHDIQIASNEYFKSLKLTMKPNWCVNFLDTDGLDFVGYRVFRNHVLIRNRIRDAYIKKCLHMKNKPLTDHNRSSYYSYKGILKNANTFNLQYKYGRPLEIKWGLYDPKEWDCTKETFHEFQRNQNIINHSKRLERRKRELTQQINRLVDMNLTPPQFLYEEEYKLSMEIERLPF